LSTSITTRRPAPDPAVASSTVICGFSGFRPLLECPLLESFLCSDVGECIGPARSTTAKEKREGDGYSTGGSALFGGRAIRRLLPFIGNLP
jgi:hypothetical protein